MQDKIKNIAENLLLEAYKLILSGIIPAETCNDEEAAEVLIDRAANVAYSMVKDEELTIADSVNACAFAAEMIPQFCRTKHKTL